MEGPAIIPLTWNGQGSTSACLLCNMTMCEAGAEVVADHTHSIAAALHLALMLKWMLPCR